MCDGVHSQQQKVHHMTLFVCAFVCMTKYHREIEHSVQLFNLLYLTFINVKVYDIYDSLQRCGVILIYIFLTYVYCNRCSYL